MKAGMPDHQKTGFLNMRGLQERKYENLIHKEDASD